MSSRFGLFRWSAELAQLIDFPATLTPRWNIAPASQVLMLRLGEAGLSCQMARWGLTPAWLTDFSRTPAQARAETLAEQPMFAEAFKLRRALLPANGFYEWRGLQRKRPYWMSSADAGLLYMAAIWEAYPLEDQVFYSVALITRDEAGQRRPLLFDESQQMQWLDPAATATQLQALLQMPAASLRQRTLAHFVNDPNLDAPECLTPA